MKTLHQNWITEGSLDFEYKKYILLAYLQHCKTNFTATRLYPPLGELVDHYRSMLSLKQNVENLKKKFPQDLAGLDPSSGDLLYHPKVEEDSSINAISEIVEFALPSVRSMLDEGKDVYEYVENHLRLEPIGVLPVYSHEGYVFIHEEKIQDVYIYQFKLSNVTLSEENFRSLNMNYVYKTRRSITNSFEQIKLRLVKQFAALPNPATFLCLSSLHVPLHETLLPVTKRLLMKNFSSPAY
jgi:hypothetical protein